MQSGDYLWNCGYFVGSIDVFEASMKEQAPELYKNLRHLYQAGDSEEYKKRYLSLDSDTIDYALMEKLDNLLVVPANFDWMDLGSYGDIHDVVSKDEADNHLRGSNIGVEGVENAYVHNEENKPIAVIGLDNVAIVNTPDGLLVARKDQSQKVKDVVKKLKDKND